MNGVENYATADFFTYNGDGTGAYGVTVASYVGANRKLFKVGFDSGDSGLLINWVHSASRFAFLFNAGDIVVDGNASANIFSGNGYNILDSDGVLKFKVTLDIDNKLSIYGSDGTTKLFDLDNDGNAYFKGTINAFNLTTHA